MREEVEIKATSYNSYEAFWVLRGFLHGVIFEFSNFGLRDIYNVYL